MLKIIRFLQENPYILNLLKENKVSLIGVNANEKKAILEAFNEKRLEGNRVWS